MNDAPRNINEFPFTQFPSLNKGWRSAKPGSEHVVYTHQGPVCLCKAKAVELTPCEHDHENVYTSQGYNFVYEGTDWHGFNWLCHHSFCQIIAQVHFLEFKGCSYSTFLPALGMLPVLQACLVGTSVCLSLSYQWLCKWVFGMHTKIVGFE